MKKILYYIFALLLFNIFLLNANATTTTYARTNSNLRVRDDITVTSSNKNIILKTPAVDESEKIYDYSDLISSFNESSLLPSITTFINAFDMDMAIVTIDYNNKQDAQNYADDFFDYNNFGNNSSRDGVLMLIDMDNREIYISTSGYAQLIYDDYRIDKMLDEIAPKLTSGKYYEAVQIFISKASYYAKEGIPSSNSNYTIDENGEYVRIKSMPWLFIFAMSGIITVITMIILASKHKLIRLAKNADSYLDKSTFKVISRNDTFLTTYTSKVAVNTSSGGSHGGSSTHHSSSGRSHGGGGRHF